MNSMILKLILLSLFILVQTGCDITFKRKTNNEKNSYVENSDSTSKGDVAKKRNSVLERDSNIIASFYAEPGNAIIRKDMMSHTKITKNQNKQLVIGEVIPREFQVMPLPLVLERHLSSIPLHMIRVHISDKVILMNVKSRRILDVIKI